MSDDDSDTGTGRIGLSRRDYFKALGMAGAAGFATTTSGVGSAALTDGDVVSVGSGNYATTKPQGVPAPPAGDQILATDDVAPPYPTNGWWTRELLGTSKSWWQGGNTPYQYGFGVINAVPTIADTIQGGDGFYMWYGEDWGSNPATSGNISIDYNALPGLKVGHAATDQFADTRCGGYGDWHTTIEWGHGTNTGIRATFTKGSPFTFLEYEGGEAELALIDKDEATVATSSTSVFYDGGNVLGLTVTANGKTKHFGVYAPSGVTFDGVGSGSLSSNPITTSGLQANGGYLTVAALPDGTASTVQAFEQYAYNFVRDTTVDWNYVTSDSSGGATSTVETTFTFDVERKAESSTSGTLAWLFPHQYKYTDATLRSETMFSARGTLKLFAGSSFTTTKKFPGILPTLPNSMLTGAQQTKLSNYVDGLINYDSDGDGDRDPYSWGVPADTYWVGKDLYRNAAAAPIAEQTGHSDASFLLDAARVRLESWFDGTDTSFTLGGDTYDTTASDSNASRELFYYSPDLGTLVGYPSDDFWFARAMNDHHFHYGYFVRAAAEVARQNPGWADQYGDMVELLIRDYANWERPANNGDPTASTTAIDATTPKNSPKDAFPFLRNFDPYAGHSWAGGLGSWSGNNQESSSEAVNAYAAMIMWGEITGNQSLRDAGIFLYTQEIHAVWEYWFDAANDSLPDTWGQDVANESYAATGSAFEYATKVRGIGYDRNVFWNTTEPIEHFGINWLPMGGHSFYLAKDRGYANANWARLLQARENDADVTGAPDENFLPGWRAAAWGYRAISDANDAASLVDAEMTDGDPVLQDGGNSGAFAYQFVHAIEQAGWPATDVAADHPFHQVFEDGTERTYVVHNTRDSEVTVTFSDGFSMTVGPNTIASQTSSQHYTPDTTPPTQPSNLTVTGTTYESIDLSWDASTDAETGLSHYAVTVDGTKVREVSEPSVSLSGLDPGTQYTVGVRAVDLAGNRSGEVSTTASTKSADTAIPPAPEAPFAIEWDSSSVELGWTPVQNIDFGVDHYNVYVDGQKAAETTSPPTTVTGLSSGDHSITLTVVNGAPASNESDESPATSVTLSEPGTNEPFYGTPQPLPGRLELEAYDRGGSNTAYRDTTPGQAGGYSGPRSDENVDLGSIAPTGRNLAYNARYEWIEYTVDVQEAGTYEVVGSFASATGGDAHVEIDGKAVGSISIPSNGSWVNFTQSTVGTVDLPAGKHVLRLFMEGGGFNLDYLEFQRQGGDDTAPSAPSNLTADPGKQTAALSWDAASDGQSSVFLYHVYQGGYSADGSPTATITGTSTTIEGLQSGMSYTFAVTAEDAFGNESDPVTVTTETLLPSDDTTAPPKPSNLRVPNRTMTSIDLAWDPATDNVGVDHYVVSVNGTDRLETDRPWTTVDDLETATTYDLAVRAVDAAGNVSSEATLSVTTADRTGQAPFRAPIPVPGPVKVENFDVGGQGVAYMDTTPGNEVNQRFGAGIEKRDESDVDLGALNGDYNAGFVAAGEWLEFTIDVERTGLYDIFYEVAAGSSGGGTFTLSVDGIDVAGKVSVSPTGGWTAYATRGPIKKVPLTEGTHVLRFQTSTGGFNVDQFSIKPATGPKIDRTDWTVTPTAAFHDANGGRAIDGDPATEWASNIPFAETAITYEVDMGESHDLGSITVNHVGEPQAPSTFDVQVSSDGSSWSTVKTVQGASTNVVELGGVTARYFRLVDRDTSSTNWWKILELTASKSLPDLSSDTTAPAAPSNLTVTSTTGTSVDLSWDAVGADDLHHYNVMVDGTVHERVTSPSATLTGLRPDETYDIAVAAVDAAGNESQPASVTATTKLAVTAQFSTVEISATTLAIGWNPDGPVRDARLVYSIGGGSEFRMPMVKGESGWSAILGGLTAGETVEYRIEYDRAGQTVETGSHSYTFAGERTGSIDDLSVTGRTSASVTLSWTTSNLSSVTGFTVFRGTQTVASVGSGTTEVTVDGLDPNTEYQFVVTARTDGNSNVVSTMLTARTLPYTADQASAIVSGWIDGRLPDVPIPGDELDYGTIRDVINGTGGDEQ